MNKQIQNVVTEMIDGINYQQMIGGEIFLNLKDVAIGLGFERERERNGNITKTIRWDNIKKYLSEIDDRYLTQEVGLDLFNQKQQKRSERRLLRKSFLLSGNMEHIFLKTQLRSNWII